MSTQDVGVVRSENPDIPLPSLPSGLREFDEDAQDLVERAAALAQSEREQLARDIADIEHAAAALRRAEPALESWTEMVRAQPKKPSPLWLLIGVLWLSTAIVTTGALLFIATIAG